MTLSEIISDYERSAAGWRIYRLGAVTCSLPVNIITLGHIAGDTSNFTQQWILILDSDDFN